MIEIDYCFSCITFGMDRKYFFVLGVASVSYIGFYYLLTRNRKNRNLHAADKSNTICNERKSCQGLSKSSQDDPDLLPEAEKDPNTLTTKQASFLVSLLTSSCTETQIKALVTIGKMSAFTKNQNLLRSVKCLEKLISLVVSEETILRITGSFRSPELVEEVLLCLNNLALNEDNNLVIQDVIPTVIDILRHELLDDVLKQNCFNLLVNLSLLSISHEKFPLYISNFIDNMFNKEETKFNLPAMKVLINLSNNDDMAAIIIYHKIPSGVTLIPSQFVSKPDVMLRWLTLLSILLDYVLKNKVTALDFEMDSFKGLLLKESHNSKFMQDLQRYLYEEVKDDYKEAFQVRIRAVCDKLEMLYNK